jgi:DNA-binding NarL/FixJ family response regulator
VTADRLRVVLVDDHELVRSGVRAEIGGRPAVPAGTGERSDGPAGGPPVIEIVGEAGDVGEAIDVICDRRPDVVLLDVHLPGGDAPAVIGGVVARGVGTRYLALSVSDAAEDVIAVIRAGARGYVTKTISGSDLRDAVHRVADGDVVFSPRLAGFVLDAFAATSASAPVPSEDPATDPGLDLLSAREREVMQLLARGYTYREIGSRLFISVKTVESHASNVLRKLQLSNRNELTRWAATNRLL